MLLIYDNAPYPIGIAINSWRTKRHFKLFGGHFRMFVIFPIIKDGKHFLEIGRFEGENSKFMYVKPHKQQWRDLTDGPNDGFGDEAEGYPVDFETAEKIYAVWQDGWTAHPEESASLYEKYSFLVDSYILPANEYLKDKHDYILTQARERHWYKGLDLKKDTTIEFPFKK